MNRKILYLAVVLIGEKEVASHDVDNNRRQKESESATHRQRLLRKEDESQQSLLKIKKEDESRDDEPLPAATRNSSSILVDYLYTYGAPSISNPPMSNPGNRCIPGIRAYTENVSSGRVCSWWDIWCDSSEHVTNTDNVAQANVDRFPHAKMSTLVLRLRDGATAEYIWKECKDSEEVTHYYFQSWPASSQPAGVELPELGIDNDIHHLHRDYVPRLIKVPNLIRGPMVEYASVPECTFNAKNKKEIKDCLESYSDDWDGLPGLDPDEWETIALMNRVTDPGGLGNFLGKDQDSVYVLKNDEDPTYRKCIISFEAMNNPADAWRFYETFELSFYMDYCGSSGVQVGMRNELWDMTHDPKYKKEIKPALETCHEVTCVGNSHGGALCNIFTMCANTGLENIRAAEALATSSESAMAVNEDMYDDYYSLAWNKK